jgi:hypothetical protein
MQRLRHRSRVNDKGQVQSRAWPSAAHEVLTGGRLLETAGVDRRRSFAYAPSFRRREPYDSAGNGSIADWIRQNPCAAITANVALINSCLGDALSKAKDRSNCQPPVQPAAGRFRPVR